MSESKQRRVKTTTKRQRHMEVGGSSSAASGRTASRREPNYSPTLQATRLAKFQGRKLTYIKYVDISWLVEQGLDFPHQMELQGANAFLEMQGRIYPSVVREFYSNFQYKDETFMSLVGGKLIMLDEKLFLDVGVLTSFKYPYGRFETALWNAFEYQLWKSRLSDKGVAWARMAHLDPKVGGGVGETCKVTKDQTQHSPRAVIGFSLKRAHSRSGEKIPPFQNFRSDPLAQARDSRSIENLTVPTVILSLKRGILAQARISQCQQPQFAISRLGEATLAQTRIFQYSLGFHPPR
ncbi:hypothetical protein Lal_00042669 [Lupinus albus]|nr:hypothetical protein Lal_00042669 [Lupinus albus]